MHKYYFKIKKNDTEFEFSTDNLDDFDTKVLEWTNSICTPKSVDSQKTKRMDFIDIQDLTNNQKILKTIQPKEEDFEQVLQNSIEKPKLTLDSINNTSVNEISKIIEEKNVKSIFDCLIITAFYIMNRENTLHFTLKQINSRLVPIIKEPVTHPIIQDAVVHGYVEIVPDLTGMGDLTEYTLTVKGEEYYNNEL